MLIEEEFPITKRDTPAQEIWAEKWAILKSALLLARKLPFNELAPDILQDLCQLVGFTDIQRTTHAEFYREVEALDFFQRRLESLLPELPNENFRAAFIRQASDLRKKMLQVGGMEIPFYRVTARKTSERPKSSRT